MSESELRLRCIRCDLRGPAASFYWIRGMGWCCAQHPEEAHVNVLMNWFLWCMRRGGSVPQPRTEREVEAYRIADMLHHGGEEE